MERQVTSEDMKIVCLAVWGKDLKNSKFLSLHLRRTILVPVVAVISGSQQAYRPETVGPVFLIAHFATSGKLSTAKYYQSCS